MMDVPVSSFDEEAGYEASSFFRPPLYLMPHLFDRFYRTTWDLLSTPRKTKKGKKGNCAMVVASCNRMEGASTIALNLATAFSSSSMKSVMLVDANLRNPILHEHFGCERELGLSELVQGEIELEASVVEVRPDRFYFIPAGRQIQNPILLFETPEFVRLLDQLRGTYDLIIFDAAPLSQFPETPILASGTDGLILVLEAEGTRWEVAQAAKNNLETANANVFGTILNKREYFIPPSIYKLL